MLEDSTTWVHWIYFPPEIEREVAFDLNIHMRIFSGYTVASYDSIANHDGCDIRQINAPFLDLLLLLKRLVRYGPSFHPSSNPIARESTQSINGRDDPSFFRTATFFVNITFNNDIDDSGNASSTVIGLDRLVRCGIARGFIHDTLVHMEHLNCRGRLAKSETSDRVSMNTS